MCPQAWAETDRGLDPVWGPMGGAAPRGGRSPLTAVRLENLWLDDLITGTAHYEIEVVMCWVMAK